MPAAPPSSKIIHPANAPRCRVLVVEHIQPAARALRRALDAAGFHATAAFNAADALVALSNGPPFDVILLDLTLPDAPGEVVIDFVDGPCPRVLVMTDNDDTHRWVSLLKRGCKILRKPCHQGALLEAVRWLAHAEPDAVGAFAAEHALSPRQSVLLRLATEGLPTKEIADVLDCKPSTVWNHWHRIQAKTHCRSQMAVMAKFLLFCSKRTPPPR